MKGSCQDDCNDSYDLPRAIGGPWSEAPMTAGATSLDGKTMDPADSILAFGCANNPNPSRIPWYPMPIQFESHCGAWPEPDVCFFIHVQTWEIGEDYVWILRSIRCDLRFNNKLVYDTQITIFRWGYKSTNISRLGASSCRFSVGPTHFLRRNPCDVDEAPPLVGSRCFIPRISSELGSS